MSTTVTYTIKAVDEASATIKSVSDTATFANDKVATSADSVAKATDRVAISSKSTLMAINNVATGAMGLYSAYDRVNDAMIAVDAANLKVDRSEQSLATAQANLNRLLDSGTASAEQIALAENQVKIATDAVELAHARAADANERLNEIMILSATQVVPSVITMLGSAKTAYGGLKDMMGGVGMASTTAAKTVGTASTGMMASFAGIAASAGAALAGIGLIVGMAYLMYEAWKPLNEMWASGTGTGAGGIGTSLQNATAAPGTAGYISTTASAAQNYLASVKGTGTGTAGTTVNVNAPLVNVEGSADAKTAELAASQVMNALQSVTVGATSTGATTSQVRTGSTIMAPKSTFR